MVATEQQTVDLAGAERAETAAAKRKRDAERKRAEREAKGTKQTRERGKDQPKYADGATAQSVSVGIGLYLEEIASGASTMSPEAQALAVEKLDKLIAEESRPIARLKLRQKRLDIDAMGAPKYLAHFVKYAAEFGKLNGITYAAFRESGVSAAVLKQAGVER